MGRVKDITPKKTVVIVSYSKDGLSCRDIARKLGVSKSAVAYVIKRQNESGSFARRKGSGRLRKTSRRDDNAIRRSVIVNPLVTSPEIKLHHCNARETTGFILTLNHVRYGRLANAKFAGNISARKPVF